MGLSDGKELIVGTPDGASDRRREGCALPDGVMLGVRDGSTDGCLLGKSVGFNEGATS